MSVNINNWTSLVTKYSINGVINMYIFALRQEDKSLIVLAILHERMELIQRLKDRLK